VQRIELKTGRNTFKGQKGERGLTGRAPDPPPNPTPNPITFRTHDLLLLTYSLALPRYGQDSPLTDWDPPNRLATRGHGFAPNELKLRSEQTIVSIEI